jgi:hypothetical protein
MLRQDQRRGNVRRVASRCPRCAPAAERLRGIARRQLFARLREARGSVCLGRAAAADLGISLADLRQAAVELAELGAARLWVAGGGVLLAEAADA